MGLFDKLKFWKKNDDDGLGDLGLGKDDIGPDPFGDSGSSFPDFNGNQKGDSSPQNTFSPQQSPQRQEPSGETPSASSPFRAGSFGGGQQGPSSQSRSFGSGMPAQHQNYGQSYDQPDFNRPFTMSVQQAPSQFQPSAGGYSSSKDLEIISSKLDTLRSSLDMINQRLSNLERMYEREEVRKRTGW